MSAETLRRAAALMRERAEAATPGPWEQVTHPTFGPQSAVRTPDGDLNISAYTEPYRASESAAYIASLHPAVALAVADLLDNEANAMDRADGFARDYAPVQTAAYNEARRSLLLAVARAYLGEQP